LYLIYAYRSTWLAAGCCWLLLAAAGCCWLLLAATGCCWLLLAAAGRCWPLLAAAGCCWLLLAAAGCCWLLLAALRQTVSLSKNVLGQKNGIFCLEGGGMKTRWFCLLG
jgi:hypothetical protein